MCRASSCTPERLDEWYEKFLTFMKSHDLHNKPRRIWNADESGFPLCPKTSRVLALRNKRHVYSVNADSKTQITTLVAASAAGSVIPPMHIFPGVRLRYDPLAGAVDGSYLGRSDNGWMQTHLFYGWVANHFVTHIPPERPVLLLVDGHTTHIDLYISKFCKENGILLYCLLPHSSHITQPLDVGFFGALKLNWKKACDKYKVANMGSSVTKQTFASVFNAAWTSTVKMSTIVNSFAKAGIYPINRSAVGKGGTLDPGVLYSESTTDSSSLSSCSYDSATSGTSGTLKMSVSSSLEAIESRMDPSTVTKFNERFSEGYDVPGDELYSVWEHLKRMSLSSCGTNVSVSTTDVQLKPASVSIPSSISTSVTKASTTSAHSSIAPLSQSKVNPNVLSQDNSKPSVFSEILTYPQPIKKKSSAKKGRAAIPSHLNSSQVIAVMENEKRKKEEVEQEKLRRKAEREARKAEKEKELQEKRALRESRRAQQAVKKSARVNARSKRSAKKKVMDEELFAESESSSTDENAGVDCCPECSGSVDSNSWVACDKCEQWYHVECTSIPLSSYGIIGSIDWACQSCCTQV